MNEVYASPKERDDALAKKRAELRRLREEREQLPNNLPPKTRLRFNGTVWGAPGSYEHGKVYLLPSRNARLPWFEIVDKKLLGKTKKTNPKSKPKPKPTFPPKKQPKKTEVSKPRQDSSRGISIVVPFYQKQEVWKKTWEELRIQLSPKDEVIVVDDYSPNGIEDCDCPHLKVVNPQKLPHHIYRLNSVRNTGILEAKNDTIVVLDPDCIPNPNFVENARRIYDPSVLFAGVIDFVDEDGNITTDPRLRRNIRWMDTGVTSTWGGCMMFSKTRAALIGWYSPEYDGSYGPDDSDFGYKCFHSGMRIRLSEELRVLHQYHPARRDGKIERGELVTKRRELFFKRRSQYGEILHLLTPYRPAIGVLVITMMRPYYIDQCLRAVFRNNIPVKVFLVNQADKSKAQMQAIKPWRDRWAVEYVENESLLPPAVVKTEAMKRAAAKGYKYIVILDDDMTIMSNGITNLVRAAENNPEYHAIAGWYYVGRRKTRFCGGGYILPEENHQHYVLPVKEGVHEVDFVGTGWIIIRLDPLILYDVEYDTGWNDWDWSWEVKSRGLKLAVCGDAGAYHRYHFTNKGVVYKEDPINYSRQRRDSARHERMADRYEKKWGYRPRNSLIWKGSLRP